MAIFSGELAACSGGNPRFAPFLARALRRAAHAGKISPISLREPHVYRTIFYYNPIFKKQRYFFAAFALQINCVIVPIGQYTHQLRGLNSAIVIKPSTVDVSITL